MYVEWLEFGWVWRPNQFGGLRSNEMDLGIRWRVVRVDIGPVLLLIRELQPSALKLMNLGDMVDEARNLIDSRALDRINRPDPSSFL